MADIKSIVRGDYLEDAIQYFTKTKIDHPVAQKVLLVAKAILNTLIVFIVLAPLAIIAKPLIGIALTGSFAAFVACFILNLQAKKPESIGDKVGSAINQATAVAKNAAAVLMDAKQ